MKLFNKSSTGTDAKPRTLVRFPLGIKLVLIVTAILLGAMWTITALMGLMVNSDFVQNTEDINFTLNNRAAAGIEEGLYRTRAEALLLLEINSAVSDNLFTSWQVRNIFFERNPNIAAVIIPGSQELINRQFFDNNEISHTVLTAWLAGETDAIERARKNDPVILNASPVFGINLLALFYPWQSAGFEDVFVVFFSPQNLLEITAAGSSSTLLVNGNGDILVSHDFNQVLSGANISDNPLGSAFERESGDTVRVSYTEAGNRFLAAGRRIYFADAAVFSILDYSHIVRQITAITRRNIFLSITVMFIAVLATWFYSKTITTPLKNLIAAARRIELGEFDLPLKPKSWDELGVLTERFLDMGKGLSRWEGTRDLAGRYNSQMITRKFILGEVNLAGEKLEAVILYAELTSFQDISEKLNANEALPLLNTFISQLTQCVEETGGVIDKIMGSKIIALWGVPALQNDIATEVMNSIISTLKLRDTIAKYNSDRESPDAPIFTMSCGIHTGRVFAGSIGIQHYSVYTVAGDVVNTAVSNGEIGIQAEIDIVLSQEARSMAAGRILAEKVPSPRQSKNKPNVFGLINLTPDWGNGEYTGPNTIKDIKDLLRSQKKKQ